MGFLVVFLVGAGLVDDLRVALDGGLAGDELLALVEQVDVDGLLDPLDSLEVGEADLLVGDGPDVGRRGAAAGVTRFDFTDVKPINYRTDDPCGMIQGEIIAETWRKKQIIVGIVGFKDYLLPLFDTLYVYLIPQL